MRSKRIGGVLIALVSVVPTSAPTAQTVRQDDEIGVRAFLKAWDDAWGRDAHALALLHAPDCVTVNRYGAVIEGRAVERAFTMFFSPQVQQFYKTKVPDFQTPPLKPIKIRFLSAALATVQAEWKAPSPPGPDGAVSIEDMIVSLVLVQREGKWLAIQVDLHNVRKFAPSPPG